MKTLGSTMGKYLILIIFRIILVLYTIFIATKLVGTILVENISGVSAKKEALVDELRWSLIGKSITDPAPNSKPMLTFGENHLATEEYLASIRQRDNVTTKKPDNSF
jgi:hypothetical protein